MREKLTRLQYNFLSVIFISFILNALLSDFTLDSSLRVSSSGNYFSFLTYSFSSYLAYIDYLTGDWLVLFFLFYSFFYYFIFRKREHWSSQASLLITSCTFIGLCFIFSPNLLGDGLYYILKKQIEENYLILSTIFFTLFSFYICIGESFSKNIEKIKEAINIFSKGLNRSLEVVNSASQTGAQVVGRFIPGRFLEKNISDMLRGKTTSVREISYGGIEEEEEEEEIEEEIESLDESDDELSIDELIEETKDLVPMGMTPAPEKKVAKKKTVKRKASFTSGDLIESISLGSKNNKIKTPESEYFDEIIDSIESKLAEFKIAGKIINILKGPVVDTFELELGTGVKVSKVNSISKDLSLALCGAPIRIVYPMKGRSTIGIEVPRNPREIIYLDEVLKSKEYASSHYRLPIAMGKNAFGEPAIVDLASMPHMLVAGATGAGKSVFINTLLVSLLIKLPPEKMKLILIDPKQLELALYANLPHLILPVMTDSKSAAMSLLWACQEMERRYSILKEVGVRNIESFNKKIQRGNTEDLTKIHHLYEESDPDTNGYELPYIVIIVDEFADLILTKMGKDIENNICRLAAKARAAGIHLVLATQRPSVDVITGLIKANFPTRVSFRVTSNIDSRTILNAQGAEMLLGMGDMLYKHGIEMLRLHSGYVDEDEIEGLVEKLGEIPSEFDQSAMEFVENEGNLDESQIPEGVSYTPVEPTGDALYDKAVQVVMEHRQASASMLQRRLRIGYNRAANLIDQLEESGVVGPQQGSKPREVLGSGE